MLNLRDNICQVYSNIEQLFFCGEHFYQFHQNQLLNLAVSIHTKTFAWLIILLQSLNQTWP